jgi:circadian clock protein KaiC
MAHEESKLKFGIAGLDEILSGGLLRGGLFVMEGEPGSGKTTVALQFVLAGAKAGERSLYITLSESERELRQGAASHDWTLGDEIEIFELNPPESVLDPEQQQSLLYSSDLELGEIIKRIFDTVERVNPSCVVVDSLSEIRLLAQSSLRYRLTAEPGDKTAHSVAQGVIHLEELAPDYGAERRRLRILKYRGQKYRGGYHDFTITTGGVNVFPRLVAAEHRTPRFARRQLSTGIKEFDALLGGGIDAGSSTLILGPAGTGKSLISIAFAMAAIARGEKAALFIFDEELGLLFNRMKGLGIDLEAARDRGDLSIAQIDAAELSPGEFAHRVRKAVDAEQIRTVVIDSLNGYQAAMPEENSLLLHVHELLQYLNRQGATTFMTVAQHGLVGQMQSPVDVTYLADTVILLRFFEASGQVRRAISVIKKRTGSHESTIREYRISRNGLSLGEPLAAFEGVLRGTPTYLGEKGAAVEGKRR